MARRFRLNLHFGRVALLAVVAVFPSGCATQFVAKEVNPLRPARTAGWEPGELSASTNSLLQGSATGRNWARDPAKAVAALESLAPTNLSARRGAIEVALAAGMKAHRRFLTDRGAAGYYLCAAENAADVETQGDADFQRFCTAAKRYAVARLVGLRDMAAKKGLGAVTEIKGPTRTYRIGARLDRPGSIRPDQFSTILPTDRYRVAGARELAVVEGEGTPLIGKVQGPEGAAAAAEMTVSDGSWVPLTATVEFGSRAPVRQVTFGVYDRNRVETVTVAGRRQPLAGDFSTPFAVRTRELNRGNLVTLGILGFFRGDRLFENTGLYPLEFPNPNKIPVVLVHGLISEPNDWRFLHNALLADPVIRQRYQFWAFYYPTSLAVPWSSTRLRQGLANAQERLNPGGQNPNLNRMVLVGHSMGGLLSRMQIVGGGEKLYDRYFKRPPEELRLDPKERRAIRDMFFFQPNPRVDEVIFICVPHQGSFLATNWVGRIARMLARLPLTILETTANFVTLNADALKVDVQLKPGTSIDSLSPGGEFATLLQELPMTDAVKKYSIIGNRGKGGDRWLSSDGVVPYWSSHIEGVPETLIPSNHSGPEHAKCAEIMAELLKKSASDRSQSR